MNDTNSILDTSLMKKTKSSFISPFQKPEEIKLIKKPSSKFDIKPHKQNNIKNTTITNITTSMNLNPEHYNIYKELQKIKGIDINYISIEEIANLDSIHLYADICKAQNDLEISKLEVNSAKKFYYNFNSEEKLRENQIRQEINRLNRRLHNRDVTSVKFNAENLYSNIIDNINHIGNRVHEEIEGKKKQINKKTFDITNDTNLKNQHILKKTLKTQEGMVNLLHSFTGEMGNIKSNYENIRKRIHVFNEGIFKFNCRIEEENLKMEKIKRDMMKYKIKINKINNGSCVNDGKIIIQKEKSKIIKSNPIEYAEKILYFSNKSTLNRLENENINVLNPNNNNCAKKNSKSFNNLEKKFEEIKNFENTFKNLKSENDLENISHTEIKNNIIQINTSSKIENSPNIGENNILSQNKELNQDFSPVVKYMNYIFNPNKNSKDIKNKVSDLKLNILEPIPYSKIYSKTGKNFFNKSKHKKLNTVIEDNFGIKSVKKIDSIFNNLQNNLYKQEKNENFLINNIFKNNYDIFNSQKQSILNIIDTNPKIGNTVQLLTNTLSSNRNSLNKLFKEQNNFLFCKNEVQNNIFRILEKFKNKIKDNENFIYNNKKHDIFKFNYKEDFNIHDIENIASERRNFIDLIVKDNDILMMFYDDKYPKVNALNKKFNPN